MAARKSLNFAKNQDIRFTDGMKTSAISQQAHHDAHKSSQEKIKNKRLQLQIGLILK